MRYILAILFVLLLISPCLSLSINVTPKTIGTSYIEWQWDAGYNLTSILIDGTEVCGYETTNNTYLAINLGESSLHTINVTNGTVYGDNRTYTLEDPPVPISGGGGDGGGVGLIAGLVGGMIGAIIFIRRGDKQ